MGDGHPGEAERVIRELGGKSRAGDPNAEEGSTISSSECQRGVHVLDFRSTLMSFARTVREAGRESTTIWT